jgi:hypothetical protein
MAIAALRTQLNSIDSVKVAKSLKKRYRNSVHENLGQFVRSGENK